MQNDGMQVEVDTASWLAQYRDASVRFTFRAQVSVLRLVYQGWKL